MTSNSIPHESDSHRLHKAGIRRTDIPHRGQQPKPAHMQPEGAWTTAGTFTSYRCGYDISFWGEHQFNFLALVEVQPDVRLIHARPRPLEWFDGERWHRHVPDFLVRTLHGESFFDVEEGGAEKTEAVRLRERALRSSQGRARIGYRVFGAAPLLAQPRLANSKTINAYARTTLPEEFVEIVSDRMAVGEATANEVGAVIGADPREVLAAALHLVWHGRLHVDIHREVDIATTFRRSSS